MRFIRQIDGFGLCGLWFFYRFYFSFLHVFYLSLFFFFSRFFLFSVTFSGAWVGGWHAFFFYLYGEDWV